MSHNSRNQWISRIRISDLWIQIRETQKHTDPTDPEQWCSEEGAASLASLCIAGAAELAKDAAAVGGRLAHLGLTARHAAEQARQEHLLVLLARRACVYTKTNIKPETCNCSSAADLWHLVWIRIRGSMPMTNGSGAGCGSWSFYFNQWPSRCQQKTNLKKSFSAFYFLKILIHYFSKVKSQKEVTKQ